MATLDDGTLLVLDRGDGSDVAEHPSIRFLYDSETALVGRFVVAAYEPIGHEATSLRLFDAAERHLVATLPNSRVLAPLPDGDALFVVNDQVLRLSSP